MQGHQRGLTEFLIREIAFFYIFQDQNNRRMSHFIARIILVEPNTSCSRNALQPKTVFDHSARMPTGFLLWKRGFLFLRSP